MHTAFLNMYKVTQRERAQYGADRPPAQPFGTTVPAPTGINPCLSRHRALRPFPREALNGALNVEPGSTVGLRGGLEFFVRLFNVFLAPFSGLENKNVF